MSKIKWLDAFSLKHCQRLSLAFLTMMLVALLSASPSLTQQYSPEQSEIVEKIEKTATLDYKTDSIDIKNAVENYKESAAEIGLTEQEIREIYQQKIIELKNSKPKIISPWKDLEPFGWLFGLGALLWAFFKDAINKKGAQVSQSLINAIYKQFSGTKLFRNFALEQYRKALSNKYRKLKIPFRPNRPLKMSEVYVPLQLVEQNEPIDAKQAVQRFKRLMIVGQPGSGKTMLLKSLALNYANRPWDIPQQPVAIFFELNRLSDTKLTIEQQLVKALERDDFPNGTNFVEQGLKQGMIMLLFDGLDEVNSTDRPNVVRRLQDFIDQYDQCRVAITCRTQVYKQEFDTQLDQTVEVVEFNDQQIRNFLHPWKRTMGADKSVEQLLKTLQDRPRIMELARNPLMLTIIAYLYTDTAFVLPHSRAEFYQEATDILLKTWDEARQTPNRYKGRDKKLVLRHLALYGQDQTQERQQDRRHLAWQNVNEQVKSLLPNLNLRTEDDLEPILAEICERSGLLMPIDGGEAYRFPHLTLQEFFAATQLIDDEQGLIERFEQDPDVWRETAKLWCGLAGDSTRLIRAVYQKDKVTAFSCLADAQNVEPELVTEIIDYFKSWIRSNQPKTEDTILGRFSADSAIKAFGAVAAGQRSRGQDVFDFLKQTLSQGSDARTHAAKALATTNLPQAAQVLADHYLQHTEIQSQLRRMGNLAVPKLQSIAEDGHVTAVQHLGEIGTPFASRTLVPLLWNYSSVVAFHAAVQLASLLQKRDIEEDLATFPANDLRKPSQTWQGIWYPFEQLKNSSISLIAEHIIDQLDQGIQSQELELMDLPDLDPRIVLPICILSMPTFCQSSKEFIDKSQALLENTEQEKQLEIKSPPLIREALQKQPKSLQWEFLLKTLSIRIQLDVLYRLNVNRPPTRHDWQNLYKIVTYDFKNSWHYRLVVTIMFFLSIIAIFGTYEIFIRSSFLLSVGISVLPAFIIVVWLILWRGKEEPYDPNLFMSLGLWGPISFCREYVRLVQNQIVWNGAQAIFDTISRPKNFGLAFISVFTFITYSFARSIYPYGVQNARELVLVPVAFFVASSVTIFGTGAGALVVASASTCAEALTKAVAVTFQVTFTVALANAVFMAGLGYEANSIAIGSALAAIVALAMTCVGIVSGMGIGSWIKQPTKPKFSRYLAILAAPFFLGSPLVILCSTLFLHRVTGSSWPIVGLLWLGIVSICTLILRHGRHQEQLAQNPLRGILPDYDTATH